MKTKSTKTNKQTQRQGQGQGRRDGRREGRTQGKHRITNTHESSMNVMQGRRTAKCKQDRLVFLLFFLCGAPVTLYKMPALRRRIRIMAVAGWKWGYSIRKQQQQLLLLQYSLEKLWPSSMVRSKNLGSNKPGGATNYPVSEPRVT